MHSIDSLNDAARRTPEAIPVKEGVEGKFNRFATRERIRYPNIPRCGVTPRDGHEMGQSPRMLRELYFCTHRLPWAGARPSQLIGDVVEEIRIVRVKSCLQNPESPRRIARRRRP